MTDMLDLPPDLFHVFRRKDALNSGVSDREIDRQVRTGQWIRLRHGAYTPYEVWKTHDAMGRYALLNRAVLLQAASDAVLGYTSALPEYGAPDWGLDLRTTHLVRRDGRIGRAAAGVRQHAPRLQPDDVVSRRGIEVTSPTLTALQATQVLTLDAAIVHVSHLLHQGLTTEKALRERYTTMEHDPFTLRTDLALRLADARIESVLEARGRYVMSRAGIPAPDLQYEIRTENGDVIARLDAAFPELKAWFEFDGIAKYVSFLKPGESTADAVLREKKREDFVRELTGWTCLRITWADLDDMRSLMLRMRRFLKLPECPLPTNIPGL